MSVGVSGYCLCSDAAFSNVSFCGKLVHTCQGLLSCLVDIYKVIKYPSCVIRRTRR